MQYDVIIIGAGPAGASAALELARRSALNVLVLDKVILPREKPCGGAMPSSVEKLLNLDLSLVVRNRTEELKFYHNYDDEVCRQTLGLNAPLLVNRAEFDMFVLQNALAVSPKKIEVRDNARVKYVKEEKEFVHVLLENGEALKGKYLIAADGVFGKTASMVDLMQKRKLAQTFDADITTTQQYYMDHANTMVINYFCLPHGYGWIFPKGKNRFSCGIGTWDKPINIRNELDDFLSLSFPKNVIIDTKISGYPIPLYQGRQQIATNRVLLTGDAAALVDPVSGEGIRHALHSGKIAGKIICEAMAEKITAPTVSEKYQKMIHEKIGKELKAKLFFESLAFHNNPKLFYRTFVQGIKNKKR